MDWKTTRMEDGIKSEWGKLNIIRSIEMKRDRMKGFSGIEWEVMIWSDEEWCRMKWNEM